MKLNGHSALPKNLATNAVNEHFKFGDGMKLWRFVVAVFALWALGPIARAEDVSARVLLERDALPGWETLRSSIDGLSVKYRETTETLLPEEAKETITVVHQFCVRMKEGYAKNTRRRLDMPGLEDVEIENPEYAFRVSRAKPDAKYSMTLYDAIRTGGARLDEQGARFNFGYLVAGYFLEPYNLFEVLRNKDFEVVSTLDLPDGCVQVELVWRPSAIPQGTRWVVALSPKEHWAIKRASLEHPQGDTQISIEYQNSFDGGLIPKEIRENLTLHGEPNQIVQSKTVVFESPAKCEELRESFYATAYGLPKPGSGLFQNPILVMFCVFAVAVVILLLKRKSS